MIDKKHGVCLRRRTLVQGVLGVVLAVGAVFLGIPTSGASPYEGQVLVYPSEALPGAHVSISGNGFPPNSDVQVQICGDRALGGSVDCTLKSSQEVATTPQGQFQVKLAVTVPPKPCPCVVMALDFGLTVTPTTPITVIGAPYVGGLRTPAVKPLKVKNAEVGGDGPWTAWFGGSPKRTLVLRIYNPNVTPYLHPPLILAMGHGTPATTKEATEQVLPTIPAHRTVTVRVPVSFPALSIGGRSVAGTLGNPGLTTRFGVETGFFPWGLLVLLMAVLVAGLYWVVQLIRRGRDGTVDYRPPPIFVRSPTSEPTVQIPAPRAGVGVPLDGGYDPSDPTWQLE